MKYLIINTDLGFTLTDCQNWQSRDLAPSKKQLISQETTPEGQLQYFFNLPTTNAFKVVDNTLYYGQQWIGTISKSYSSLNETIHCVYFNFLHAAEAFEEYIKLNKRSRKTAPILKQPNMAELTTSNSHLFFSDDKVETQPSKRLKINLNEPAHHHHYNLRSKK